MLPVYILEGLISFIFNLVLVMYFDIVKVDISRRTPHKNFTHCLEMKTKIFPPLKCMVSTCIYTCVNVSPNRKFLFVSRMQSWFWICVVPIAGTINKLVGRLSPFKCQYSLTYDVVRILVLLFSNLMILVSLAMLYILILYFMQISLIIRQFHW